MSKSASAMDAEAEKAIGPDGALEEVQVKSNKIPELLAQESSTLPMASVISLISTPADDLAEDDFAARVTQLLQGSRNLAVFTICIPSMARLHPSNSLPKVLDILKEASNMYPGCSLGLIVQEAEQAWTALPILTRIDELGLRLQSMEFSRAFFPVEAIIEAGKSCGLASLTLDATQVFSSSPDSQDLSSIQNLTSLTIRNNSEPSPGLDTLLSAASSTVTSLDLSSCSAINMHSQSFPNLTRLRVHENLLAEVQHVEMHKLRELTLPVLNRVESCETVQKILRPQVEALRLERIVAGDVSEALVKTIFRGIAIGELAIYDPARVTPDALVLSERLVNMGPPIAGDWPHGFEGREYRKLKSITLKVLEGSNLEDFIASLDAPNLGGVPSITVVKRKKGKGGK